MLKSVTKKFFQTVTENYPVFQEKAKKNNRIEMDKIKKRKKKSSL